MPSPALSQKVQAVEEETFACYSSLQPIAFSIWGTCHSGPAEDLSDAGLAHWEKTLQDLNIAVSQTRKASRSRIDEVALRELKRFLNQQILIHVQQRPYTTRASPYIQLCCLALLPILVGSTGKWPGPIDNRVPNERIKGCIEWLKVGDRRLKGGTLTFTEKDRSAVSKLRSGLMQSEYASNEECKNLVELLEIWQRNAVQSPSSPSKIDLVAYIHSILGVSVSLSTLERFISKRLLREISCLEHALKVNSASHSTPRANDDEALQPTDWLDKIDEIIRGYVPNRFLKTVGPKPNLVVLPSCLETLVSESLYLPPTALGNSPDGSGTLLINPWSFGNSMSPLLKANLALTLAHELCPGHDEHYRRSRSSPLSHLYTITRSMVGLEGWAFLAESTILGMRDEVALAEVAVYYQRVRRFGTVLEQLGGLIHGKETARGYLMEMISPLPSTEQARLLHNIEMDGPHWLRLLPYCVGLIETENALARIQQKHSTEFDPSTIETYLGWGPLHPHQVVQLALEYS